MHSALALKQFEHGCLRSHFTFLLRQRMHEGCFAVADPGVVVGLLFESVMSIEMCLRKFKFWITLIDVC